MMWLHMPWNAQELSSANAPVHVHLARPPTPGGSFSCPFGPCAQIMGTTIHTNQPDMRQAPSACIHLGCCTLLKKWHVHDNSVYGCQKPRTALVSERPGVR